MASCTERQRITREVHSDRSTTNALFHVFKRVRVDQWVSARGSVIVAGSSGSVTVTAGVRYGNDEADLDAATPVDMGDAQANDGVKWGTLFGTLNDDFQIAEFGASVKNGTGTKLEMGMVTLVLDLRK